MAVLVTGGAGYIGSHTCVELLNAGYDVVVADNLSNSSEVSLQRVEQITGKPVAFYRADVRDASKLDEIFERHDIRQVIHFAGFKAVGESVAKPLMYYRNNLDSTIGLCEAMLRHKVGELVFSSSATVYSPGNTMPLSETSSTGNCTNPYGWTKFMCEEIIMDVVRAHKGFSAALLRYFNPVGAHPSGLIGEDPSGEPGAVEPAFRIAEGHAEPLLQGIDHLRTALVEGLGRSVAVIDGEPPPGKMGGCRRLSAADAAGDDEGLHQSVWIQSNTSGVMR